MKCFKSGRLLVLVFALSPLCAAALTPEQGLEVRKALRANDYKTITAYINKENANVLLPSPREGGSPLPPLIFATKPERLKIAKYLIKQGADVNYVTPKKEFTPLSIAALQKNNKLVKLLIKKGADVNKGYPLIAAATGPVDDPALARYLIKKGVLVKQHWPGGVNAAHQAAGWGNLQTLKVLAEHGINLNAITEDGQTPLAAAVISGHDKEGTLEIVKYLAAHGASVLLANDKLGEGVSLGHMFSPQDYEGEARERVQALNAYLSELEAVELSAPRKH